MYCKIGKSADCWHYTNKLQRGVPIQAAVTYSTNKNKTTALVVNLIDWYVLEREIRKHVV